MFGHGIIDNLNNLKKLKDARYKILRIKEDGSQYRKEMGQ